jgi:hypothetical protein
VCFLEYTDIPAMLLGQTTGADVSMAANATIVPEAAVVCSVIVAPGQSQVYETMRGNNDIGFRCFAALLKQCRRSLLLQKCPDSGPSRVGCPVLRKNASDMDGAVRSSLLMPGG